MDDELVQLASIYQTPGHLLLATVNSERAGCVGLRDVGLRDVGLRDVGLRQVGTQQNLRVGEVRRLFVRPEFRTTGAGRELMTELIKRATDSGIQRLVLNTLPEMKAAQSLYESLGFAQCEPYVEEPLDDTLYFGLAL